jgi:hypothetical protein
MENQTPVEKIFEWIEEDKISELVEIKEWFLMEEEKIVENAILYALDADGHTGEWKLKFAQDYIDRVIRKNPNKQQKKYFGNL